MANSSTSSNSSHTLSDGRPAADSAMAAKGPNTTYSAQAKALLEALQPENRYTFITPKSDYANGALELAKTTLDHFAKQIVEEQEARREQTRKDRKRKRGEREEEDGQLLRIKQVHTRGFQVEQVWEQARRVIEALKSDVSKELEELKGDDGESSSEEDYEGETADESEDGEEEGHGVNVAGFDEEGFEIGSGEDNESMEDDEEGSEGEVDEEDMEIDMDGQDDYEDEDIEEEEEEEEAEVFVPDQFGLNDGFFSIDEFNKQTEFLEQQDANADPYTGEASDEEDIDWDADPLAEAQKDTKASNSKKGDDSDEEEEEDEEDGPTFGNMNLDAPEGDSEDEDDVDMDDAQDPEDDSRDNTNDIHYSDFFAPPAKKLTKGEKQAAYLARQAKKDAAQPEDEEHEMERAMADVRRDLFDDEDDLSEDELSEVDPADPKSRRSAHERRQAKLQEEIRTLEAASVQKREWQLSGEAKATDRPVNALLEEDLDFERTGKPVPVITAEVSESIEELIKRRILAQEFDEVVKRRPDADAVPVRRGAFELDDNKNQQSLAELYEEEHVKNANPDAYMSKADEKLKKAHLEIEGLWKEVSAKLDALSSWTFKPKPPAPSLTVVSDVATVAMEDAQPTMASGLMGADSMLAPQEIYKAGADKASVSKGEVVAKSGLPVARQEMTREEKLRRRRREKERIRKAGGETGRRPEGKRAKEQRETVNELKKAGVKVINKKGEITDADGKKVKTGSAAGGGAGGFKL
jgi:U3 small nucleolar RNA-associated protein MPP10